MGHILRKTWEAFVVIPMPEFERKAMDVSDLWRFQWTPADRDGHHGAEKPVALYEKALALVTSRGDVVLDPFCGSGTTGVAAIRTGRRVVLIERDEDYAEVARARCEAAEVGTDWKRPEQGAFASILKGDGAA